VIRSYSSIFVNAQRFVIRRTTRTERTRTRTKTRTRKRARPAVWHSWKRSSPSWRVTDMETNWWCFRQLLVGRFAGIYIARLKASGLSISAYGMVVRLQASTKGFTFLFQTLVQFSDRPFTFRHLWRLNIPKHNETIIIAWLPSAIVRYSHEIGSPMCSLLPYAVSYLTHVGELVCRSFLFTRTRYNSSTNSRDHAPTVWAITRNLESHTHETLSMRVWKEKLEFASRSNS
jgi:hypothetical protein